MEKRTSLQKQSANEKRSERSSMKNKKLGRLAAILSVILVVAMGFAIAVVTMAAPSVPQATYFDFEDGVNPFYLNQKGTLNPSAAAAVVTDAKTGEHYLSMTNDYLRSGEKDWMPYGSAEATTYDTTAAGLKTGDTWNEGTRPTLVKFRFKAGTTDATMSGYESFAFHPLQTNARGFRGFKVAMQVNVKNNKTLTINQANYFFQQFKYTGEKPNAISGSIPIVACSEEESPWIDFQCTYDWSEYTEADGWKVSIEIRLSCGNYVCSWYDTVAYQAPTSTAANVIGDDPAVDANTTFTVGFESGGSNASKYCYVDDLIIWSETVDGSTTYAPQDLEPKALGAVALEQENPGDGTVSTLVRGSFDFRTAKKIADGNDETVTGFGALAVAGTKSFDQMKEALNALMANPNDAAYAEYKLLSNGVTKKSDVPDIYTVTATNSGELENMGKRLSCIAYIRTDKGIYLTDNSNSVLGVQDGVVNKSAMGLIKDGFAAKYLTADYADALETVLLDYNAEHGTSYTPSYIKNSVGSSSTAADKLHIPAIYRLMQEVDPGAGEEVFPGNW